jgi:hypothetical protein
VREQVGRSPGDLGQPCHRAPLAVAQPLFVLPADPPHQVVVEPPEEVEQPGLVEAPVVVDPPLHDAVEHPRKVVEGLVTAAGQVPRADLGAHRLDRVRADRGQERHEMLAVPVLGQPRPELIAQERELDVLVGARAVRVLAVHDARLVRMQLQTDLRQTISDRIPHVAGLALAAAVDHHVIAVALEPHGRILPGHPGVERVMHEQVGEQRRDR